MYLNEEAAIQAISDIKESALAEMNANPVNARAEAIAGVAGMEGIKVLLAKCGSAIGDRDAYLRTMAYCVAAQEELSNAYFSRKQVPLELTGTTREIRSHQ